MRRNSAEIRVIAPDWKYGSAIIGKLINKFMWDGKKSLSSTICYTSLEAAAKENEVSVLDLLSKIMENVSPKSKIISRRVGSSTFSVPKEIPVERRVNVGLNFIVNSARKTARSAGKPIVGVLTKIFIDSYKNIGIAVEQKNSLNASVESNKIFEKFSW